VTTSLELRVCDYFTDGESGQKTADSGDVKSKDAESEECSEQVDDTLESAKDQWSTGRGITASQRVNSNQHEQTTSVNDATDVTTTVIAVKSEEKPATDSDDQEGKKAETKEAEMSGVSGELTDDNRGPSRATEISATEDKTQITSSQNDENTATAQPSILADSKLLLF